MAACTVSFLLWIVTLQWISAQDYSSQWAAHIEGGLEIAKRVTEKHGFVLLGEIFPDYYHLEHNHVSKRSVNPGLEHHKKLTSEQNAMCIWTLGNLSDSSPGACKVLQSQNFFDALVNRLQSSSCDDVIFNTFYALRLFLKNYMHHLKVEDLNKLLHACLERLNLWKESFWIVYQISCYNGINLHHTECMGRLLDTLNEDIIDITCLIPILRTFGNIIAHDHTGHSAYVFFYALLREEGSIIRNILINNRDIDLNYECAWLLGNAFKALNITELNGNDHLTQTETFDEICNYLLI